MAMILPIMRDGRREELHINLWDMVAWEDYARENRLAINAGDNGFQKMKYTGYLAYSASKRVGNCPADTGFQEWLATAEIITDELEIDADVDPTYGPVAHSIV